MISWPRTKISKHMFQENISLITARSNKSGVNHFYCSEHISDVKCGESSTGGIFAPLYLYPDENDLEQERRVNIDKKILDKIEAAASTDSKVPNEIDIFDYIYGVLHCPEYRETFAEFLKIDFPRVPCPSSADSFWEVSSKGKELRKLHTMKGADAGTAYPFKGAAPEEGGGFVSKKTYVPNNPQAGRVFVNETQYFEEVPIVAWDFYLGGYQPAQKWLKDRKGQKLSFDDRMHYRKIIHVLLETDRIMKTIKMDL